MSDKIVKEIKEIESVEAVAIISFKGNIWWHSVSNQFVKHLKTIGVYALRMLAAYKKKQTRLLLNEIHWQDRILLIRYSEGFFILVVFNNQSVLPLLRITLNVAVANLLEEKNFLKWLKKEKYKLDYYLQKGQFDEEELSLISKLV